MLVGESMAASTEKPLALASWRLFFSEIKPPFAFEVLSEGKAVGPDRPL